MAPIIAQWKLAVAKPAKHRVWLQTQYTEYLTVKTYFVHTSQHLPMAAGWARGVRAIFRGL